MLLIFSIVKTIVSNQQQVNKNNELELVIEYKIFVLTLQICIEAINEILVSHVNVLHEKIPLNDLNKNKNKSIRLCNRNNKSNEIQQHVDIWILIGKFLSKVSISYVFL